MENEALDRWRGRISAQVEGIEKAVQESRVEQARDHAAIKQSIEEKWRELDARLKPLEQLRLILIGIFMALGLMVPVIWIYASRVNALLDKVQKIIPLDSAVKQ